MKTRITQEEFQEVEDQSRSAHSLLKDPQFSFAQEYINNSLKSIEDSILNNTVHDVTERVTITQSTQKDLFIPKEEQINELCGQYKWIKKFLADMEYFSTMKENLDKAIEKGDVIVEGQNGKDIK